MSTRLTIVRDVLLSVMAVAVTLVCVLVLVTATIAGSAIADVADRPSLGECLGEEPPAGC